MVTVEETLSFFMIFLPISQYNRHSFSIHFSTLQYQKNIGDYHWKTERFYFLWAHCETCIDGRNEKEEEF